MPPLPPNWVFIELCVRATMPHARARAIMPKISEMFREPLGTCLASFPYFRCPGFRPEFTRVSLFNPPAVCNGSLYGTGGGG